MDGKIPYFPPSEESDKDIQDELEHSYAVAKRLLPFLAKRGIPVTPKNYRIFFDYLLYANPDLNKTVNELLANNARFYQQLSDTLYEHFYSNDVLESHSQVISKAAADFMAVSSETEQSLETVINQTNHYQKVLSNTSKHMADVAEAATLQPMLEELLNETETALQTNGAFSDQINEASQIIANLKAELKNQTNLAKVDELTKLYNRRHLNYEMPHILARAATNLRPVSLALFDLDHFKRVNDTWGHNFGDRVLVICAEIIKKTARSTDLAVRLGGEEFVLVLPGLDLAGAAKVAERVRSNVANTDITIRGESLMVTISGGVAQYAPGEDLDALIGRADQALYQAKGDGRNLIRVAELAQEPDESLNTPSRPGSPEDRASAEAVQKTIAL